MDDAELFAPTTEQVRAEYVVSGTDAPTPRLHAGAEFDRWLAAHDREVAAKALEAVIGQMKLTESRMPEWTHPLTEEPAPPSEEFQRGYREGRFKVQHILGVLLSSTQATGPEQTESNGEQR